MPQYKKAFDIGTYTGNGGQYRVGIPTLRGVGPTGTQVANSLRFRYGNSNFLNRTFSSGNRKTWTWSGWFKRGALGVYPAAAYGQAFLGLNDSDKIWINDDKFVVYLGTGGTYGFSTYATYKDTSIWYHFMVAVDTTQATSTNRVKMYVNGVEPSINVVAGWPTQNYESNFNSAINHNVGKGDNSNLLYLDGYLAENYFIDGQALTPSSFGEFNNDGIWVPKAYSGSYGTNGFYLKFAPGAAGTDSSGNGNTWTLNGFNVTTANTTYDIMTDSPTDYLSGSMSTANNAGNYATLSPYNKSSAITLSNGNLYFTGGSSGGGDTFSQITTTFNLPTSGKWYFEMQPQSTGSDANTFGFNITRRNRDGNGWPATRNNPGYPGYYSFEYGLYLGGGVASDNLAFRNNYVTNATTTTVASGIVTNVYTAWYGVAIDCDSSTFQMYRNGVALGTASSFVHPGSDAFVALMKGDFVMVANFGQQPFSYGIPSGYKTFNTYNIPRPADSSLWFYGDTPDLMWIKNRSTVASHCLFDRVKGTGLVLYSNLTNTESGPAILTEMNKFGMTVSNDSNTGTNGSGNNFVYWAWKAGSNTSSTSVTNTDGAITSQVSANRQAGFSIVNFQIPASGTNYTVGHGLGAVPSFWILKNRNYADAWYGYHTSLGAGSYFTFSSTAAATSGAAWGSTNPTSSVFTIRGTSFNTSATENLLMYIWTAIPGYSAFSSYTGNGSNDGSFVYLGFRPRWIMFKNTSTTSNWLIIDAVRNTYNPVDAHLHPNLSNAESIGSPPWADFTSNGFKLRNSYGETNTSSQTYIYAAFAESPFKFARAR